LNLRRKLFGKPLDPLDKKTRRHIALVAFFAWVGLGADGISSSCYGPEEASGPWASTPSSAYTSRSLPR